MVYNDEPKPPPGQKVEWEVQIPGHVTWTMKVEAVTQEEAIAVASARLDADVGLEPDDNPEPEFSDAEIMGWEEINTSPEAVGHDGEP
jgi:hypothetical protein